MMMTAAGTVSAGQGVRHGRRRRRAAGDRHRAAPRRAGQRDRRPLGDQGADPVARRQADLRRECRRDRGRGQRRLRHAKCREEYQKAQAELVSSHIAKQDIVITTALIPGKPAPRLISDAQLATMRPGSVIVDLAAEAGGNVEGCVAGESVERHGVTIIGAMQPGAQPGGRRLGAVRAQPLQFPQRLLGQGGRQAGASRRRRDRQGHPPDAGRQGRARAARRLRPGEPTSDILVIGGGVAGLSAAAALGDACQGHRARGRGGDRLPLVGPQRDHAPLCARRPAGPRADARQPALLRSPAEFATPLADRRCRCWSMPATTSLPSSTSCDADIAPFAKLERVDEEGVLELCPLLRTGDGRQRSRDWSTGTALRLDPHALLQGYVRAAAAQRAARSSRAPGSRRSARDGGAWTVDDRARRALRRADR